MTRSRSKARRRSPIKPPPTGPCSGGRTDTTRADATPRSARSPRTATRTPTRPRDQLPSRKRHNRNDTVSTIRGQGPSSCGCSRDTRVVLTGNGHPAVGGHFTKEVRRCPTLPQGPPCSTIGAVRLSFRVRNVTGRFPHAMAAETLLMFQSAQQNHCHAVLDRTSRTTQWTQAPKRCVIKSSAY